MNTPLNPDALEAAARATYEMRNPESWAHSWGELDPVEREEEWVKPARTVATAYLAVAQPEMNSVEDLVTTRVGIALANAAFNEGMSAGIRACNESLEGEPFVKPVSPYRPEVKP